MNACTWFCGTQMMIVCGARFCLKHKTKKHPNRKFHPIQQFNSKKFDVLAEIVSHETIIFFTTPRSNHPIHFLCSSISLSLPVSFGKLQFPFFCNIFELQLLFLCYLLKFSRRWEINSQFQSIFPCIFAIFRDLSYHLGLPLCCSYKSQLHWNLISFLISLASENHKNLTRDNL